MSYYVDWSGREQEDPEMAAMRERPADALDICNACDINEADPDSLGGYCTECQEAANKAGTLAAQR